MKLIITKKKGCCSNCDEDYNYRMNLKSVFDNAIFCYTCDSYQELKETVGFNAPQGSWRWKNNNIDSRILQAMC